MDPHIDEIRNEWGRAEVLHELHECVMDFFFVQLQYTIFISGIPIHEGWVPSGDETRFDN